MPKSLDIQLDLQDKYVKEFIAKAKEYVNIEKLTPEILRAFIKQIDVYEKEVRYSRTCGNTIVIQYTFQLDKNWTEKYPEVSFQDFRV